MIRIDSLTLAYNERTILDGASLHLKAGELCALIGRNGAGKSTLIRAITSVGDVKIEGKPLSALSAEKLAQSVAIVTTETIRVANLQVRDVVAMGRAPYTNWVGHLQDIDRQIVDEALDMVGMKEFAERDTSTLSDGELQRAMIARAIAQQTPIIVLDEPTAMLDPMGRDEVMQTVRRLNKEMGITVVLITHFMDEAVQADRVVVMDDGRIVMQGTPREVFSQVEKLRDCGLDVPQSTELCHTLGLKEGILNVDECVDEISRVLGGAV